MSLSALDVNVSDIDVSALGINVSSLDIKTEGGDTGEVKCLTLPENGDNLNISGGGRRELVEHKVMVASGKLNVTTEDKEENFAALFGLCERNPIAEHNVAQTTFTSSVPVLNRFVHFLFSCKSDDKGGGEEKAILTRDKSGIMLSLTVLHQLL